MCVECLPRDANDNDDGSDEDDDGGATRHRDCSNEHNREVYSTQHTSDTEYRSLLTLET